MEGGFRGRHVLTLSWGAEGDFLPFSSFEAVKWIKHCNRQLCVWHDEKLNLIRFNLCTAYVVLSVHAKCGGCFKLHKKVAVSFLGWGREERCPGVGWMQSRGRQADIRAPGGASALLWAAPLLQGEAEGIWIRVPPGPCGALWGPFLQRPWRTERRESGVHLRVCVCLFVWLRRWHSGVGIYLFISFCGGFWTIKTQFRRLSNLIYFRIELKMWQIQTIVNAVVQQSCRRACVFLRS